MEAVEILLTLDGVLVTVTVRPNILSSSNRLLGVRLLGDVYGTLLATSEPRMELLGVRLLSAGVLSELRAGGTASRAVLGVRVLIRSDEAVKLPADDTELGVGGSGVRHVRVTVGV